MQGAGHIAYDSNNNLTSITKPTGAHTSIAYADSAHPFYPTQLTRPEGNTLNYAYDANGNLTTTTDGLSSQNTTHQSYNANGTPATHTDPDGNVTGYQYDSHGNLSQVAPPGPVGIQSFAYDGVSRVQSATDGKNQTRQYTYDALDRVTNVGYSDGTNVTTVHNTDGNRQTETDPNGTTSYTYDAHNRVTSKAAPGAQTISYAYDGTDNQTALTDNSGTTTYSYNSGDLLDSVTEPDGAKTTFAYDANDNRTATTYPNGVSISDTHDASNRLQSINVTGPGGALKSYTYDYSHTGTDTDLRWRTTEDGVVTTNTYDALNRLTDSLSADGHHYSYVYDGAGNRTMQTVSGGTLPVPISTQYSYNAANELTGAGTTSYSYDGNGNETATGIALLSTFTLAYNAGNQTIAFAPLGSSTLTAVYLGSGQQDRLKVGSTTLTTSPTAEAGPPDPAAVDPFTSGDAGNITQAPSVDAATDASGSTYYTRDEAGTLIGERTPSGTYYYVFDGLGSVTGLTNAAGTLAATYKYDPYGNTTATTGSVANPWRFAGEYFDASTGLYAIGARYYDPATGRWTQVDPIQNPTDPAESSPYVYANDDPVNNTDPSGMYFRAGGGGGCKVRNWRKCAYPRHRKKHKKKHHRTCTAYQASTFPRGTCPPGPAGSPDSPYPEPFLPGEGPYVY